MKKSLLILFLVAMTCDLFALMQQTGWRWRNDDGNLTNATWRAADTIATTITDTTQFIRLRSRIDNMGNGDKTTTGLGYSTSQILVGFNGGNAAIVAIPTGDGGLFRWATSAYVANGDSTDAIPLVFASKNLTDVRPAFRRGVFLSSSKATVVKKDFHTELEYCFKPTSKMVPGDYYFFPKGGDVENYPLASNYEKMPKITFNGVPYFSKGLKSGTTVVTPSSMIDTLCSVNDLNLGQTLTWTLLENAKNGVVSGFPATALSTKSKVTPANLLYTPNAEYQGKDSMTVVCTDGFSSDTIAIMMNVSLLTSLKDLVGILSNVVVSPNPASDFIQLSNLPLNASTVKVSIINAFGKISKRVNASTAEGKAVVSVNDLPRGLYIVEIQNGISTIKQKMIKK